MTYDELVAYAREKLFIIAEAGVNHNGDLKTALQLVDAAVDCGCDAIKFQTWITEKVYCSHRSVKPEYQARATAASESEFTTIKKLELSFESFQQIKAYCDERGILFFSTPDESESADFLVGLGMPLMKTASQDVTNTPFLKYLSGKGLPIIFSTGACTIAELAEGVEAISAYTRDIVILHCVSSYPAPFDQMNLAAIPTLAGTFGFPVGFSDHTEGIEVACAAVALGARVFEKHLTLDRNMAGPDHQASLAPQQMKAYCQALRNVHSSLGDGVKRIMPCELDARNAFRRFVVAARDIPAGTVLTAADFVFKKVVDGIAPKYLGMLVGRRTLQDVESDTPLQWCMVSAK
jgi:N,N'-diacetyllegionaminate synthase